MRQFFQEIIETIKGFITSKKFETYLWQSLNGAILVLIAYLQDLSFWWVVPAIGLLNYLTKWLNINYLKKQ